MTTSSTKFGIELEGYGVDRGEIARALRAAGIEAFAEGYSHATPQTWKIVTDASISGSQGFEVVSPILSGDDGLAQIKKVCETLTALGAKVNTSTGFHVHVDARTMTLPVLKNVCRMWMKYEPAFDTLMPASRRSTNPYCQPILQRFQSVADAFTKIGAATSAHALRELLNPQSNYSGDGRYHKLNLHAMSRHGTLEFRQHSGTVEAAKVVNWVKLVVGFVDDAGKYANVRRDKVDGTLDGLLKVTGDREAKKFYRARKAAMVANPS